MSIFNIPLEKDKDNIKASNESEPLRINDTNKIHPKTLTMIASVDIECLKSESGDIEVFIDDDINNSLLNKNFVISNKNGILSVRQINELRGHTLIIKYFDDFDEINIGGACNVDFSQSDIKTKKLNISGTSNVNFSAVCNDKIKIKTENTSTVEIEHLLESNIGEGDIEIKTLGTSDLRVKDFHFSKLDLSSSGTSDLHINVFNSYCVKEAKIQSSGTSTINIKELNGEYINITSSGTSEVFFGNFEYVEAISSGTSDIKGKYCENLTSSEKGVSSIDIKKSVSFKPLFLS